jgi:6-phosphogluconolactonase
MAKTLKPTLATYYVFDSPEEMALHMAEHVADGLASAAKARGVARIALSGGNTPRRTLQLLACDHHPFRSTVPWDKLEVYFVDERTVPPTDKDSNYRMVREALLDHVPLAPERVFRMEGELPPEEAAARYESAMRNQMRLEGAELPSFDILTLGMGDDGHTASLFPHTEGLSAWMGLCVANHVPQKDTWRITLTAPVLNHARDVVFLIAGADKAAPLREVLLGEFNPEEYPSQLVRPASGALTLLLERAAAAQLPEPVDGKGTLEISR